MKNRDIRKEHRYGGGRSQGMGPDLGGRVTQMAFPYECDGCSDGFENVGGGDMGRFTLVLVGNDWSIRGSNPGILEFSSRWRPRT